MEEVLKQKEPFWGEWRLEEFIGSGACGEVWKIRRGKECAALKVISFTINARQRARIKYEGMNEENCRFYLKDMQQNFLKEYNFMKELGINPYIVPVYEAEKFSTEYPDQGWMLLYRMDLLEPMYQHLQKIRFTVSEIVKIGIHICRALDACRGHNIVHRDLAPGNIFYNPDTDSYMLGDFGMAERLDGMLPVPEKAGTYAPPEVYLKNQYSYQSDLYQLGVIMYRMLNNFRIPFLPAYPACYTQQERSIALFRRYLGEIPPPPQACLCTARKGKTGSSEVLEPGALYVPPDSTAMLRVLGQIVMKAIHPDLKERYKNSAEFRKDLEKLQDVETIIAAVQEPTS